MTFYMKSTEQYIYVMMWYLWSFRLSQVNTLRKFEFCHSRNKRLFKLLTSSVPELKLASTSQGIAATKSTTK